MKKAFFLASLLVASLGQGQGMNAQCHQDMFQSTLRAAADACGVSSPDQVGASSYGPEVWTRMFANNLGKATLGAWCPDGRRLEVHVSARQIEASDVCTVTGTMIRP